MKDVVAELKEEVVLTLITICSHIAMREIGKVKEIHCIKNVLWIHEHSTTDDTKNIFRNSK